MTVTFCGHADFCSSQEYEEKMLLFLEKYVGEKTAEMFLGGYGNFDLFAHYCCKKYKEKHPNVKLVLVIPYLCNDNDYKRQEYQKYDSTIYPEIEDKPLRFAIVHRNRWMIKKSDLVVCAISREWGGAYKSYKYAKKLNKKIINIIDGEIN